MLDGRKSEPGGWNRIIINVNNLQAEVARLKEARLHFRNNIVVAPAGRKYYSTIRPETQWSSFNLLNDRGIWEFLYPEDT